MKKLILVRGVSGSGKSTIAEMFVGPRTFIVAADDYWGDNYDFDASKLSEAHRYCQLNANNLLKHGNSVVIHNTTTSEREVKVYQDIAEANGAMFFSIIVENRHGNKDVHNVPQEIRENQERKLRASIKLI